MELAEALTVEMIEGANDIYTHLNDWQATDRALLMMRDRFPGFSFEEILLKAIAVNTLYATRVYAIWRAAKHIHELMKDSSPEDISIRFVEQMAEVPGTATKRSRKNRRFVSFASKFSHFFIDEARFPILDSYAEDMTIVHLGTGNLYRDKERRYCAFVMNFNKLKESCGYTGTSRHFDRYLWLAGQYKVWENKQENAEINQEAKDFFADSENSSLIHRTFKRKF